MTIEKLYIIIDNYGNIMSWSGNDKQLCICSRYFPAKLYTKEDAQKYIRKAKSNRKRWFIDTTNEKYHLQRVEL